MKQKTNRRLKRVLGFFMVLPALIFILYAATKIISRIWDVGMEAVSAIVLIIIGTLVIMWLANNGIDLLSQTQEYTIITKSNNSNKNDKKKNPKKSKKNRM